MTEYESARIVAERYIDYQPRTTAEVRRRLARTGLDSDVVEQVISDLESAGLLDDTRFSADWVESRSRSKKYGSKRLASELRAKGVGKEQTDAALEQLDPEAELSTALALARKRLGSTGGGMVEGGDAEKLTTDHRPPTTEGEKGRRGEWETPNRSPLTTNSESPRPHDPTAPRPSESVTRRFTLPPSHPHTHTFH